MERTKIHYSQIKPIADRLAFHNGKVWFTAEDLKLFPEYVTLIRKEEFLRHLEPETLNEIEGNTE